MNVFYEWMFFLWMNVFYEWMNALMNELYNVCYFYWVGANFLMKKCKILMLFKNVLQTNQQTDRPTDTAYYRDARMHLKTSDLVLLKNEWFVWNQCFLYAKVCLWEAVPVSYLTGGMVRLSASKIIHLIIQTTYM